jgi:hypothetical protein
VKPLGEEKQVTQVVYLHMFPCIFMVDLTHEPEVAHRDLFMWHISLEEDQPEESHRLLLWFPSLGALH